MSFLTGRDLVSLLRGGRRALADSAVGSELIKSGIAPERTLLFVVDPLFRGLRVVLRRISRECFQLLPECHLINLISPVR